RIDTYQCPRISSTRQLETARAMRECDLVHSGRVSMARTPLAQRVEDAMAGIAEERVTRGELIKRGAVAGIAFAGASSAGRFAKAAYGAGAPRIVVVG